MNVVLVRNGDKVVKEDEAQMVKYYSEGLKSPQISIQMEIKERTLEKRVEKLRASYGAKTIAHLVGIFLREGIIE